MDKISTDPRKHSKKPENTALTIETLGDFVTYATALFRESDIAYGHGTDNENDEAAFIALEGLGLPIDDPDGSLGRILDPAEREKLIGLAQARVETRKPASYLLNKAYIQGLPFYVDERVIVPRSFIAEILCREDGFSGIPDYESVKRVLDLCTGSGCLAILAAYLFPNAAVDAVDLSGDALDVARRNVADHELEGRVTLYEGDLFAPVGDKTYDLILTNPPYVDKEGMDGLPAEYRHEPAMALAAGDDGMDIVHRIMAEAKNHLKDGGGMMCELGRCGPALESAYKNPFLWLSTENSDGEVFWIKKKNL
ncbi:MAG TPA: 50S ribosomal protein L3 N(5)-glutamine methyltransferase [Micavibrio sp.]|nr:50S ribosomal protein L3 N(5)-glutamine methyltransferase [Micavibrio sp.]